MRPDSVRLFDRLYLASITLLLIATFADWDYLVAGARTIDGAREMGGILAGGVVAIVVVVRIAIWYFAAKRASRVARWAAVAVAALGLWGILDSIALIGEGRLGEAIKLGALLVELFAVAMLFRGESQDWFAGRASEREDSE